MTRAEGPDRRDKAFGNKNNPELDGIRNSRFKRKLIGRLAKSASLVGGAIRGTGTLPIDERVGFLRDSIIAPRLWVPTADRTAIDVTVAPPGEWVGYDFRRPDELPRRRGEVQQVYRGKMFVADFDDLQDTPPNELTPHRRGDILDIDCFLNLITLPIGQMTESGYLKETTYGESFEKQGIDGKYGDFLTEVGEVTIYEVTPKGNGIVFLQENFGNKRKPSRSRQGFMIPHFPGLSPQPA